jgi:hypothetical protein
MAEMSHSNQMIVSNYRFGKAVANMSVCKVVKTNRVQRSGWDTQWVKGNNYMGLNRCSSTHDEALNT